MTLAVRNLEVRLGDLPILRRVDLDVGAGEVVAILGPSGSGKSTLLRAIAGLLPIAAGSVAFAGEDLGATPTHRRRIGMVFQDLALFPHLTVADNVGFGLRMGGRSGRDRTTRVGELLDLVGMPGFGSREIASLSGGERQRVAIARALAPDPRLLLFDEPFSSLDRALRDDMLTDVQALLAESRIPAVVVTHDHDEAFTLGESIFIMNDGRIVEHGPATAIARSPTQSWTAEFLGFAGLGVARVAGRRLEFSFGSLPLVEPWAAAKARVAARSDGIRVASSGEIGGTVLATRSARGCSEAFVAIDDGPSVWATSKAVARGDRVRLRVDPTSLLLYRE